MPEAQQCSLELNYSAPIYPWARGGGGAYAICTPVAIFIIINIGSASAPRGAPHIEKLTMTLLSRRTNLIVLLLASVLTSASWMSLAQPPSAEKDVALLVQQYCSAWHGLRGDDTAGPHIPYLASQQYDYLVKQLKNFQSGDRNNPIMATFAALVPPADIPALAAYFSKQPLARAPADTAGRGARGGAIFKDGIGGGTVPGCWACHGANGEGRDGAFPRIAGQRADYLANQLRSFKAKERNNDPSALMRQVAARMSDDDIAAVAAYLSGAR